MTTVSDPKADPQERAVRILVEVLSTLRTRDGIVLTEDQIEERSRAGITALGSEFDLVPAPDGRSARRVRSFGSAPPALAPGSKFAAAMAEYLVLRAEFDEADRQLGESMEQLESTAPAARSVG